MIPSATYATYLGTWLEIVQKAIHSKKGGLELVEVAFVTLCVGLASRWGHVSRDCISMAICHNCGGRGHMAFECPSVRFMDRYPQWC
ncbi:DNA-binding protein HEXBP-like [Dorcoceras hygrometricum]|uniref:DNA-binding protein HEXBP-like n=1 Tax=Dorcoceras hygrometricum TaxID=472368 RepID=A0A2Z7D7Y8_9LAMI|nr:DNA-binding protein HEXBP-like [Dorcoceras hygrometricum]